MQKTGKKLLSAILCIGLIAAMALTTAGCTSSGPSRSPAISPSATGEVESIPPNDSEGTVLGEGATKFSLIVVDGEGQETQFEIHTDQTTVGAALLELELIAGENSEYGLYVKTVNGVTVDYDTDGKYWAFYIDGEYATTGVDATDIVVGSTYSFKVE